jgi:hypothetical protein
MSSLRRLSVLFFSAVAAAAAVLAVALPASAAVVPHLNCITQSVFVIDNHGVLTTPDFLYRGETLHGKGPVAGHTFTVVSVTPAGPLYRVVLSPAPKLDPPQASTLLDFTASTCPVFITYPGNDHRCYGNQDSDYLRLYQVNDRQYREGDSCRPPYQVDSCPIFFYPYQGNDHQYGQDNQGNDHQGNQNDHQYGQDNSEECAPHSYV